jgi:hypothetical protein
MYYLQVSFMGTSSQEHAMVDNTAELGESNATKKSRTVIGVSPLVENVMDMIVTNFEFPLLKRC